MKRWWLWAPLVAFIVLFGVAASGLIRPTDAKNPSKMVGKPVPVFTLPAASSSRPGTTSKDFSGKPRLLNVFASWCIPCIAEAQVLDSIARQGVMIEGVAIRDKRADVDKFLARNGNPYRSIGSDVDSSVQLAMGSSGVPETFVVDAKGTIRHQHIGEIRREDVPVIMQKLREAQ